jgi:hypothetical protein
MFTKGRAAVVMFVLAGIAAAGAAVALASGGSQFVPKLGSPNGKHVSPGRIHMTAKAAGAKTVFLWVSRKHKLKHGNLVQCTDATKGCLVTKMKRWKHHKNGWTYTAQAGGFPGFWATTSGKYYWQLQSFAKTPPCKFGTDGDCAFYSKVGSFTVR